jgi:hypothetical protein
MMWHDPTGSVGLADVLGVESDADGQPQGISRRGNFSPGAQRDGRLGL